jgi:hypothetical protein
MVFDIASVFDGQTTSVSGVPITVDSWALGATVCCLLLVIWWVCVHVASRCSDCGYCPVWCRCDAHTRHRSR